ncbi:MAG: type II secretion system F family protein [Candidatus Diapherotrites archaeon]|nr:type II secretion system F family protein [Candidatus Diapherotrites archaeon]
MAMRMVPFSPVPVGALKKISRPLMGIGAVFARAFPYLELELEQAEAGIDIDEYGAIMIFLFSFYFLFMAFIIFAVGTKMGAQNVPILSITAGMLIAFLVMMQLSIYPKMLVRKKVRDIERNLVFALRTVLIEIKSGVSLFDALVMIANGEYGALSSEFKRAVDEINTGTKEEDALQKLAMNNPSLFFRRSLWQIVNGMKAGVDVSRVLAELVATMTKEQRIQINRYGSQLRLFSLMYMMLGVIVPSLGLTFLIILSSFPQIQITEILFWILLVVIIFGQLMYVGLIKSRRPNLLG